MVTLMTVYVTQNANVSKIVKTSDTKTEFPYIIKILDEKSQVLNLTDIFLTYGLCINLV
jgi:hypothetical protein